MSLRKIKNISNRKPRPRGKLAQQLNIYEGRRHIRALESMRKKNKAQREFDRIKQIEAEEESKRSDEVECEIRE